MSELKRFLDDESGIIEKIVQLGLVIIIAGGILVLILSRLDEVGNAINAFIEENILSQ